MGLRAMMVVGATETNNSAGADNATGWLACNTAARLYSVTAYNNTGANVMVQVFDTASALVDGATKTKLAMVVPLGGQGSFDYGDGRIFTYGITIAFCATTTNDPSTYTGSDAVAMTGSVVDCTFRRTQ